MLSKKALGAASAPASLPIEDVFSTYLYTGNSSTQTITNGIDLAGEGGMVWIKSRSAATDNFLFDTLRGTNNEINSNTTDAAATLANSVTAFNADGFSLGSAAGINVSAATYTSWTFRKAERFFDVVTYTGNGTSNRQIAHNLGTTVGSVIIKETSGVKNWGVWHRSFANVGDHMYLNTTGATVNNTVAFGSTLPTETNFNVGAFLNSNGATYVAYLFAHDPLGPSGDGSDGLIACGSYTGNGSTTGPVIDLGWEPQWVILKGATSGAAYSWGMFDSMRGVTVGANDVYVEANTSIAEASPSEQLEFNARGFQIKTTGAARNASGQTYIYIAIRRGPMREPESGTEVFDVKTYTGSSNFTSLSSLSTDVVDMTTNFIRSGSGAGTLTWSRLAGSKSLQTSSQAIEGDVTDTVQWDFNNKITITGGSTGSAGSTYVQHMFRRAPGFFDVVAYKGSGNATGTNLKAHNLTVPPEMVIVKSRSLTATNWIVWHKDMNYSIGESYINKAFMYLNTTAAATLSSNYWSYNGNPQMDADYFSLGSTYDETNNPSHTYIAYLFATLPGISKVGSYTGNGSSQTINCGFTTGARFVLIKRTNSTGDWFVWDTARGIVSGNDPYIRLNLTNAEVTTNDTIDPDSSGFIVNQVAATNVNVNAASYIYLAIA